MLKLSQVKYEVLCCTREVGAWIAVTRLPEELSCLGNCKAVSKATQPAKSILCAELLQETEQDAEKAGLV